MFSITQIKSLCAKERMGACKRLGQNFLIDKRYIKKIIDLSNITKQDHVLEIGPGLGALTEEIALACGKLIAVEFDKKFHSFLKKSFINNENVEIVHADILTYNLGLRACGLRAKFKVIGNLPYYITTPIIEYIINNKNYIKSAFVTIQKEVAQRLVAAPGGKDYGSLTCFVGFFCKPKILTLIPRGVFYPRPKVESALVELEFLKAPLYKTTDKNLFFKIIKAAFGKRRKTIANALSSVDYFEFDKKSIEELLKGLNIDPKRRGETLSLEEFVRIADKARQR